jgi:L-aminopeptidase/D-esterase-like protein
VPIVCGASIFDLAVGDGSIRPDASFGYRACEAATADVTVGNVGAGTGASVGKLLGNAFAMKGGFGAASTSLGELVVTALVVVNALGSVYDRGRGRLLAGTRDPQNADTILDPYLAMQMMLQGNTPPPAAATNTTIGCVLTNGTLTKAQATRVADMAHDGYARAIEPVHTGFDGDTVFVLSTATAETPVDLVGILAAAVMEAAIHNAVYSVPSAYGLPSTQDLPTTDA